MTLSDAEWEEFRMWWNQKWPGCQPCRSDVEIFLEWQDEFRQKKKAGKKA